MMSSIVSFCRGLSLNVISTSYQARKLKFMEVHTPSPLQTIYAQRTINIGIFFRICYQYVRIEKYLTATFLGNLRSMVTYWEKEKCLLVVTLQPRGSWTPSMKRGYKVFLLKKLTHEIKPNQENESEIGNIYIPFIYRSTSNTDITWKLHINCVCLYVWKLEVYLMAHLFHYESFEYL